MEAYSSHTSNPVSCSEKKGEETEDALETAVLEGDGCRIGDGRGFCGGCCGGSFSDMPVAEGALGVLFWLC